MSKDNTLFGSIAETYHRYLVPLIFDDYARDLVGRADSAPDAEVLELACGTGVATRYLRERIGPGGRVVATDLNPGMLAEARKNVPEGGGLEFREADGTDLPFEADRFDRIVCQFGVMFYPDRLQGYREARRVLEPGGSFVFNVWDSLARNPFVDVVHRTVVEMFPDDPPGFLALPFSYHDLSAIKGELQEAGFTEIDFAVLPRESRAPSARDVATAFVAGSPLAGQLAEAGVTDEAFARVEASLVERFGDGEVRAPMQSIAITARRPGI